MGFPVCLSTSWIFLPVMCFCTTNLTELSLNARSSYCWVYCPLNASTNFDSTSIKMRPTLRLTKVVETLVFPVSSSRA
jgi:hypothetical protein